VAFQLRQKLALVFIPILLLIARNEVLRLFPQVCQERKELVEAAGLAAVAILFIVMPWVVRLFLGLRPLPDGPLRRRLLASARRLHFRCSDLLLWNTRSDMANAMVVGLVPWVRYVVFTDRLLEDFSEDEVEAVFGHEVGHIRHYHILCYFGFLMASMFALGLAASLYLTDLFDLLAASLAHLPAGLLSASARESLDGLLSQSNRQYLEVFPVMGILLPYIFVVFGFLSRRCERQADVFGCRAVSCRQDDCRGHPPGLPLPARGLGLCPTGIATFIRALEKVALVNGISRDRPGFLHSWQHSTIARRVEFLQRVLRDPSVEARFQRRVALVKWALFLVLGGMLLFLLSKNGWQF
jgi:Zn-dependent protease with chaperone function